MSDAEPTYRAFAHKLIAAGWRSAGQPRWWRHSETGEYFDADAVARDAEGELRPVWKLLAQAGQLPDAGQRSPRCGNGDVAEAGEGVS